MTNQNNGPQGLLGSMAFGGLFFLVGAFVVLLAADVIPSDPSDFNAPRWVVAAAGAVFMLAGAMVALQAAFGPDGEQNLLYLWLQFLLGLAFMLLFTAIPLWIGFGPGEREFSTSASVGPVTTSSGGGASIGRFVFGGSGILMIFATLAMAYANWKKIRDFDG